MAIDYAAAGDLLAAYGRAWETFDGDDWVALFTGDIDYREDPFSSPLVGHNALRAYLNDAASEQSDVEFTIERHWVHGSTVLAAWHAAYTRRSDGERVRLSGFLVAEVAPDGRIARFREWWHAAPRAAG